MKLALLVLLISSAALADQSITQVELRDGQSVSQATLMAKSTSNDEALARIYTPYIDVGGLHRNILLEGHDPASTNLLCAALDSTKPFGGVGQIGVLNDASILSFTHAKVAVLSTENGRLIATVKSASQGAWQYVHENVYCADRHIEDSGE